METVVQEIKPAAEEPSKKQIRGKVKLIVDEVAVQNSTLNTPKGADFKKLDIDSNQYEEKEKQLQQQVTVLDSDVSSSNPPA